MAANSKHYLDVYVWLKKVIYSCNTVTQVIQTKKMIRYYRELYKISYGKYSYHFYEELRFIADNRISTLLKLKDE